MNTTHHKLLLGMLALLACLAIPTVALATTISGTTYNQDYIPTCVHAGTDLVCQLTPEQGAPSLKFASACWQGKCGALTSSKNWKTASTKNKYGQKEFSSRPGLFEQAHVFYLALTGVRSFPKSYNLYFVTAHSKKVRNKVTTVDVRNPDYKLTTYADHLACCNILP